MNYLSTREGLATASTAIIALENSRSAVNALMRLHHQHISADPALRTHLASTQNKLLLTAQNIINHSDDLTHQDLDNLLTTIDHLWDRIIAQRPVTAAQIIRRPLLGLVLRQTDKYSLDNAMKRQKKTCQKKHVKKKHCGVQHLKIGSEQ